jgi:hypothetical protein
MNTRRTLGERYFVSPPLPKKTLDQQGCSFQRGTFEPEVADEVYLSFREEPGYAEGYAEVKPLTLLAKTGMMRTPHGPVAFIVWQIAVGSPHQIAVVHYVDPQNAVSISLLAEAGDQTHLKLLVMNNITNAVTEFVNYENTFRLAEFEKAISRFTADEPVGDFGAASQYVMDTMGVADLLELGQSN